MGEKFERRASGKERAIVISVDTLSVSIGWVGRTRVTEIRGKATMQCVKYYECNKQRRGRWDDRSETKNLQDRGCSVRSN